MGTYSEKKQPKSVDRYRACFFTVRELIGPKNLQFGLELTGWSWKKQKNLPQMKKNPSKSFFNFFYSLKHYWVGHGTT